MGSTPFTHPILLANILCAIGFLRSLTVHVCRYQTQWLPLLASAVQEGLDTSRLIPPLDIAFVWHVSLCGEIVRVRNPS